MTALEKEFYSKDELAELLGLHPLTVYRMAQRGDIAYHLLGRAMRFRRDDIEEYLEKHRRTSEPSKEKRKRASTKRKKGGQKST